MKKIRYNKVMKTHKKLLIVAAAVLVVGGAGTGAVLALQPEKSTPKTASAPVNSQVENIVEETVSVADESPAPAVVEEQQPVETVDSVLNDATNNLGWGETETYCLGLVRERKPQWFVDVDTTKSFLSALDSYAQPSPCPIVYSPGNGAMATGLNRQQESHIDRLMSSQ